MTRIWSSSDEKRASEAQRSGISEGRGAEVAKKFEELRKKMTPASRALVDARFAETLSQMPLQRLRRARQFTQETMAEAMSLSQSDVSKIEQRADHYVSTLRRYVEAMGGELELIASFADGEAVKIQQLADIGDSVGKGTPKDKTEG